jgi:hypothetical protein
MDLGVHVKEYTILSDYAFSDHLPISFFTEIQEVKAIGSRYKLNGSFLKDPTITAKLASLW